MTIPDRVILNTLEQILSADMNRVGELAGKAAQDALLGLTKGVDFTGTFPSPVREGLLATPGAGLSVDVSAGELMWFDPGVAVGADVSRYKLGRLESTHNQVLNVADPVNPRIDLISAAVVDLDEDNVPRNILTLPARTVTPTNVDKTRRGNLDIATAGYVAGTPGASPAFPATPFNHVPLWYVYVPAAAAAVVDGHLMDAREYWRTNDLAQYGTGPRTLYAAVGRATVANFRLPTGRVGVSFGGLADVRSEQEYPFNGIVQSGEAVPIAAGTEVDHYLVAVGCGAPVGKAEPEGVVPTATGFASVAPPNSNGTPPGGGINYYPLLSLGLTNVVRTTTRAAFIGSIVSAGGGNYEPESGGLPLDKGGLDYAAAVGQDGGILQVGGWTKLPAVQGSVFTAGVTITEGSVFINRSPFYYPGNFTGVFLPALGLGGADLVAGEVTQASTWYYVYLRQAYATAAVRGRQRTLTAVFSAEAPNLSGGKPTPEAGFASGEYMFVGSFRTDVAGNVEGFIREGQQVRWINCSPIWFNALHFADINVSPLPTLISMFLPDTSRAGVVSIEAELQAAAGTSDAVTYLLYQAAGSIGFSAVECFNRNLVADAAPYAGSLVATAHHEDLTVVTGFAGAANHAAFQATRGAILGGSTFLFKAYQRGYVEEISQIG